MTESQNRPSPTMLKLGDTDRTIPETDEDIRGRKVIDRNGEKLGKVTDLLVDDAALHVHFMVVEHGGILGIGATQSFIPVEAVTEVDDSEVHVDTNLETVAAAPVYDPDITVAAKYIEDVYGYYGVNPYRDGRSTTLGSGRPGDPPM